ncbi:hypothetical protein [Spirosoma sp.]
MPNLTQLALSLLAISVTTISLSVFQLWKFIRQLQQRDKIRELMTY